MQATITRPAPRPATAADLWRLADQGRANGVLLLTEGATGERFATSGTRAGTVYRLTASSCSCPGFCHHQRCQHHSLLLAELGWLPDVAAADPEPDPPAAPAVCGECNGRGLDPVCTGHPTAAGRIWCACSRCGGRTPAPPAPRPITAGDFARGLSSRAVVLLVHSRCPLPLAPRPVVGDHPRPCDATSTTRPDKTRRDTTIPTPSC